MFYRNLMDTVKKLSNKLTESAEMLKISEDQNAELRRQNESLNPDYTIYSLKCDKVTLSDKLTETLAENAGLTESNKKLQSEQDYFIRRQEFFVGKVAKLELVIYNLTESNKQLESLHLDHSSFKNSDLYFNKIGNLANENSDLKERNKNLDEQNWDLLKYNEEMKREIDTVSEKLLNNSQKSLVYKAEMQSSSKLFNDVIDENN